MLERELVRPDSRGLACTQADLVIDPWNPGPQDTAVITHAHADHARQGAGRYIALRDSEPLLRVRLGRDIVLESLEPGEVREIPGSGGETVQLSLHPAGHVLGSAQVRLEAAGFPVTVVTGDYKREADPTCAPFVPVPCETLITEATFGLPVYRWPDPRTTAEAILSWWQESYPRPCILFTYALGKAQRIMAMLGSVSEPATERPIYCHGAVSAVNQAYAEAGVSLPDWEDLAERRGSELSGALIIAPPSAHRSPWMKRMKDPATAFASGWMSVRGARRRRGYERGFVVSDHADWPGLLQTVSECGARRVLTTHGQTEALSRYLREERGLDAAALETLFEGESE